MNRLPLMMVEAVATGQLPVPPWMCMRWTAFSSPLVSTVTVATLPLSVTFAVPLPVTRLVGTARTVAANWGAGVPPAFDPFVDELDELDEFDDPVAITATTPPATRTTAASAAPMYVRRRRRRCGVPGGGG